MSRRHALRYLDSLFKHGNHFQGHESHVDQVQSLHVRNTVLVSTEYRVGTKYNASAVMRDGDIKRL